MSFLSNQSPQKLAQETYQKLARLLVAPTVEPSQRAARIQAVEKDVILPLRVLLILILGYFFFLSGWITVNSRDSAFSADDIVDLQSFANSLSGRGDAVSAFLCDHLDPAARAALSKYQSAAQDPNTPSRDLRELKAALRALLVTNLNRQILGPALDDGSLFKNVDVKTPTDVLRRRNPEGKDLVRLNRMLLEDAYPQLSKNPRDSSPDDVGLYWVRRYFWLYAAANAVAGAAFFRMRQMSLKTVQWIVFSIGILDVVLMSLLTFMDNGFDSPLYWLFLVSILHNALGIPLALPQLLLNFLATVGFVAGGIMDKRLIDPMVEMRTEHPLDRVVVLIIWTACCYGIQVLFEKQRRAEAEATEFAVRQERLRTAGRLAGEIAHKIKNPLGIITNAAFCLQRAVDEGEFAVDEQISIIREEVERADQILTELMGYAQLAEGRVERLDLAQELEDAIHQVFPPAAKYDVNINRHFSSELPSLLMQRQHLSSVLVNLLQNAREALDGHGDIEITTGYGKNDSIKIIIGDNGPGIPPDKLDKIFEAYFTTRAKGTGLGLAIVKHNAEMYGGTVSVESKLGKGTRFVLEFPARILMRLNT